MRKLSGATVSAIAKRNKTNLSERENAMPSTIRNLKFSHMGIYVHDLKKMEEFYTKQLGFMITDRGSLKWLDGSSVDAVFLSTEPEVHHQVILASGRPANISFNPINQISLEVDSLGSLKRAYSELLKGNAS